VQSVYREAWLWLGAPAPPLAGAASVQLSWTVCRLVTGFVAFCDDHKRHFVERHEHRTDAPTGGALNRRDSSPLAASPF